MLQSGKPECGASFFEYHTTVPLKTIHTIFNSPLYEGTQLITYTQENCTRLPAKDNCLFAFTARDRKRRSESTRREKRERERLFRDKSNNRGNGLWLIDRGCVLFSRKERFAGENALSRFWIPKDLLRGEECSIWRFDRRESSFEIKHQISCRVVESWFIRPGLERILRRVSENSKGERVWYKGKYKLIEFLIVVLVFFFGKEEHGGKNKRTRIVTMSLMWRIVFGDSLCGCVILQRFVGSF